MEGNIIVLDEHRPEASKAFKDAWLKETLELLEAECLEDEESERKAKMRAKTLPS